MTRYLRILLSVIGCGLTNLEAASPEPVRVFIFAGQSNMVGSDSKVADIARFPPFLGLENPQPKVRFSYCIGRENKMRSDGWVDLQAVDQVVGPELSFARKVSKHLDTPIAIAKFTHSGSQIIDWTPEGSPATSRNLYPSFLDFIKESISSLEARGQTVELAGIFYHLGENEMSFHPYRKDAATRLQAIIAQSRIDLGQATLPWLVSQQPPSDDESVNSIDVTAMIEEVASADPHLTHLKAFDLPKQDKKLVLDTAGVLELGKVIAERYQPKSRP